MFISVAGKFWGGNYFFERVCMHIAGWRRERQVPEPNAGKYSDYSSAGAISI